MAIETETWLKDSQPVKQIPRPPMETWTKPTGLSRLNANTTPKSQNSTIPLSDRSKMNCFKCAKIGHMSSQCQVMQGFLPGHGFKCPPLVGVIQEEATEAENTTEEEIADHQNFEDSAEYLPYADDYKHEARRRTGRYRLLVDSGAAINIIKEEILDDKDERKPTYKTFLMGNDRRISK